MILAFVPDRWQWPAEGLCIYCDKPVLARRLCSAHYNRWWRWEKTTIDTLSTVFGEPPCIDSDLDFMARQSGDFPTAITAEYSRNNEREFRGHVALCVRCPIRSECAEAGRAEAYGIWGGTLPHERLEAM